MERRHEAADPGLLRDVLSALHWNETDIDHAIPPVRAYAGAWHLVIAVREPHRLGDLEYDFEPLKRLMLAHDLTTLQLIWRDQAGVFHSRNPFPVGGFVEDPATGAAAAALGGYLRDAGLVNAPVRIMIRQGEAMGRPSALVVDIPKAGGITVRGTTAEIAV